MLVACAIAGCGPRPANDYFFMVQGTSGHDVMLDRTWYQDCVVAAPGVSTRSVRTLSGHELATVVSEYQHGMPSADCTTGFASMTLFVQTLTNDHVRVPIAWSDVAGAPSAAPSGLDGVREGNGVTGRVTFAVLTPTTQGKVDQLNGAKYCGRSDWAVGATRDILACFPVNPGKGTIVVDDRTATGVVYDGISVNPAAYPTQVPGSTPHKGPLTPLPH